MNESPATDQMTDVDGTVIGRVHELEIGVLCALKDGSFMIDLDSVVGRSDLEQLHRVIGQVLERGAAE